MSQPRRIRTHRRSARMQAFLCTKCFICPDDPGVGIPSTMLGCCTKFLHEMCLLESLKYTRARLCQEDRVNFQPKCPYCTTPMVLYNHDEVRPSVPRGARAFAFEQGIHLLLTLRLSLWLRSMKTLDHQTRVRPHGFDWGEIRAEWTHSQTSN